jgi:hypothetical protein
VQEHERPGKSENMPPADVAAAGHDRCIINIKPEHVEAWLTPEGRSVDFSILWPKFQQSMATDPHKSGVDALGLGI